VNAETETLPVRVTCNTPLLFSCGAEGEKRSGRNGFTLYPVTVDMHNGKVLSLSDFFSATDGEWKSILPDIVTEIANDKGMTLLCEVPPVSEDQPFYIDKGDIVLVYRPYEITTYDAGEPCFALPMREIAPYTTGAYGIGGEYEVTSQNRRGVRRFRVTGVAGAFLLETSMVLKPMRQKCCGI
jgi:hypothetical protein